MDLRKLAASALLAAGLWSAPASAVTIAPVGTTDVTVSDAVVGFLSTNGITPSPIAPATASGVTFAFPITGGSTDPLIVNHSGGLALTAGAAFVNAYDFVIDAGAGTVFGSAVGSAVGSTPVKADLFSLTNVAIKGSTITADLLITSTLNSVLGSTFAAGADLGLTGKTFGSAETSPAPVPLPPAFLLLVGALGVIGVVKRRAARA